MRTITLGEAVAIAGGDITSEASDIPNEIGELPVKAGYVPWRQTGKAILSRHLITQDFWIGTTQNPRQCRMMGVKVVNAMTSDDIGQYCQRLS
jgi:hypothetical protein